MSSKLTKFGSSYLVDGLSEWDEIWQVDKRGPAVHQCRAEWWNLAELGVWPIDTYSPKFHRSCDTMWRHASVLHWCTC